MPNLKEQIDEAVYTVDKFCDKNPDHYLKEYLEVLSNAYAAAESDLAVLRSLVRRMREALKGNSLWPSEVDALCAEADKAIGAQQ